MTFLSNSSCFLCVNALNVSVTKCWMMLVRNLLFFLFAQWNASETNSGWERSPAHFMRTNDYLILLLRVKPLQNVFTLLQKCVVPINKNISSSALRVFSQIQSNIRYIICVENCRCPIRGSPRQLTSRSAAGSALKACLINPHILVELWVKKPLSEVSQVCQREDLD